MSSSGSVNFGASGVTSIDGKDSIIIHHLSDLHLKGDGKGQKAFIAYIDFLQSLDKARQPAVVIISGDLTSSGEQSDLEKVALLIKSAFPRWGTSLNQHVFIVPGPSDLDWINATPGFTVFREVFKDFCLPMLPNQHNADPFMPATSNYLVHLVDTCYAFETLLKKIPQDLEQNLKDLKETYSKIIKDFERSLKLQTEHKRRNVPDVAVRERFFTLLEQTFIALDTGMINKDQIKLFEARLQSITSSPSQSSSATEPLRILVTHHPLIVARQKSPFGDLGTINFQKIITVARSAGFQLALHGHLHKPQVLTDFSVIEGENPNSPLRQFGAGSLGGDHTFNEIEATRTKAKPKWQLNIETIATNLEPPASVFSIAILDPEESRDRSEFVRLESQSLDKRKNFEDELRQVMHLFAEASAKPDEKVIPRQPLQKVQAIIEDIIFKGIKIHVGLAIKRRKEERLYPQTVDVTYTLENDYISPHVGEPGYLHEFRYPTTAASWALILGRPLIVDPGHNQGNLLKDDSDLAWLVQSGKSDRIRVILQESIQRAERERERLERTGGAAYQMTQVEQLIGRLNRLSEGLKRDVVNYEDAYQEPITADAKVPFISVPIPIRPQDNSSHLVEVGVLNIDALSIEDTKIPQADWKRADVKVFTVERVDMLQTLSELIYVILTEASFKQKPPGIWEEPNNTNRR